jgi:hypothetical protein
MGANKSQVIRNTSLRWMNEESFARETVYLKNVVIIDEYAFRGRNEELSPVLRDELNEGNLQLAERIC